jgi:hypothetical protein
MTSGKINYTSIHNHSYHHYVIQILKKEKKPMSAMQLSKKIEKLKKVTGKTPNATIRSVLQRSSYCQPAGHGYWKLKPGS